jgi:mono/diheme cytochrome c family protein
MMRRSFRRLLLLGIFGLGGLSARGASVDPAPAPPAEEHPKPSEPLERGRQLFVARCSHCHGEKGEEPVDDGPSLQKRALGDKRLTEVVESRLKGATAEEKLAVKLYLSSLMRPAR